MRDISISLLALIALIAYLKSVPADSNVAAKDIRTSVPDFTAISEKEGDEAAEQILKSHGNVAGRLIRQLADPKSSANAKTLAAYLLGEFRTWGAVTTLANNIDLKAPRIDPRIRIARWGDYPAQEALNKIGTSAAAEVVVRLRTEKSALRRKLMVRVIRGVYRDDLGRLYVQKQRAKETDPAHKRNLDLALKEFPQ